MADRRAFHAVLRGGRKGDSDGGANVYLTFQLDAGVVDTGNMLDDGKPKPGAAGGLATALVHPVEALEHAGLSFPRDADAVVGHGQGAVSVPVAGGDDLYLTARAVVADGVVAQILAQFIQQRAAAKHRALSPR